MVECARPKGDRAPSAAIVESTSGTLRLGLALAGKDCRRRPGHRPGLGIIARMLTAYGAGVDVVTQPHPVGGLATGADRVAQLMADARRVESRTGTAATASAYRSLALELVAQLGRIDVLGGARWGRVDIQRVS